MLWNATRGVAGETPTELATFAKTKGKTNGEMNVVTALKKKKLYIQTKMNLNPQAIRILSILRDGLWHCPISWDYADGHTKRITDVNRFVAGQGLKVESTWCDCGRHKEKIKKRRLVPIQESEALKWLEEEKRNRPVKQLSQQGLGI